MSPPIVWTLAGSDSGGGAGIQADLLTFRALGAHGCSVVTAITAQSTLGILDAEAVGADLVARQIQALEDDLPPAAMKTGMLPDAATVIQVAEAWKRLPGFKVCDPVLASSSGRSFMDESTRRALVEHLFPLADLLTPNLGEAERFLDRTLRSDADIEMAADDLRALGPRAVLIKGGHREGPWIQDYGSDGRTRAWLTGPHIHAAGTHGTGCVLSSAIAALIATGFPQTDAWVVARAYVSGALRNAAPIGTGNAPVRPGAWPDHPDEMPWLTSSATAGRERPAFPRLELPSLRLYPIVDRAAWVERLLGLGLRWIQLRVKDLEGLSLERELEHAARAAQDAKAMLFVNDHWEAAIRLGVYGVHLGQDDLDPAAIQHLEAAGLRLGVSTHCYAEMARAMALCPSYVAIGTVFDTTTKVMDYPSLGLPAFRRMRRLLDVPVVAIGGIHAEAAPSVFQAGADAAAVISEIRDADDLEARVDAWRGFTPAGTG